MPKDFLEKIPNKYEILYGFLKSTIYGVILADATKESMPILYVNNAFVSIFGYTKEELIGKSAKLLRGKQTNADSANYIDEQIKNLKEVDIDLMYHTKSNLPFFCNLIATPIFDERSHIRYYLFLFRNISYKEEIKTLRDVLNEELKLSMEYKDAIDEASIVSKTDINGDITHINDAFCNISGYMHFELLRAKHNINKHIDMPKESFHDMWKTILSKKVWKGIVKNICKDGSSRIINTTIRPILNTKGEIVEFISIGHDITEQILAKEAAQKALESKSAFFARASHELRTPLNAIINFTEIMIEEFDEMFQCDDVRAQHIDFLNRIDKNSKHLLSLINDLLDISKFEKRRQELNPVDVHKVIKNASEACMLAAKKKNLELIFCHNSAETLVMAHERMLLQVLLNLLSNAIKFTNSGYVELYCEKTDDDVEIKIRDTGRGIPKEKIDKIFEPFEQASESDEGTGLGLKLVKDMCEAMNIKIEIESKEGFGTTFTLLARRV